MSKLNEWIDDCFSKELRDVPFKPEGAIHVIVYDNTDRLPAGADSVGDRVKATMDGNPSLTYWWKLGSMLYHIEQFADYTIAASSWNEALDGILKAVEDEKKKTKKPVTIASLQFWGHGSPGTAHMGGDGLSTTTLSPGGLFHAKAKKVAAFMHQQQGHIWFRCCSPFQGERGQAFAKTAAAVFGVPVVGHTFTIHALQSGTQVLRPGASPDWDTDEGVHKRGRNKGEHIVSSPIRNRTVTMFRLYPPIDEGRVILPAGLVAAVARGIHSIAD